MVGDTLDDGDQQMEAHQADEPRDVVEESVSHYRVQKLSDGTIRVKSGGHVVEGETYYKALARLAEWQQEELETKPDHLRENQWKSVYHDTVNPELDGVQGNDAEEIKEEVIDDVASGETTISRSGAWLAELGEADIEDLGDRIDVYRLREMTYTGADD